MEFGQFRRNGKLGSGPFGAGMPEIKKYAKRERCAYRRKSPSPPAQTVPRLEHGPDDTTQKAAPSLLEGSYFSAHRRRARRVLYIWNVARRYSINRDARKFSFLFSRSRIFCPVEFARVRPCAFSALRTFKSKFIWEGAKRRRQRPRCMQPSESVEPTIQRWPRDPGEIGSSLQECQRTRGQQAAQRSQRKSN